jgi:hypothetical protein
LLKKGSERRRRVFQQLLEARRVGDDVPVPREIIVPGANPKDFLDSRFLKEIEDSGFVQELYGRR